MNLFRALLNAKEAKTFVSYDPKKVDRGDIAGLWDRVKNSMFPTTEMKDGQGKKLTIITTNMLDSDRKLKRPEPIEEDKARNSGTRLFVDTPKKKKRKKLSLRRDKSETKLELLRRLEKEIAELEKRV